MLNCWPDAIAKFVHPGPSYGAWVRCITINQNLSLFMLASMWDVELLSATNCRRPDANIWQLQMPGYTHAHAADKWLRPIPPDELRGVEEEDTYNAEAHEAAYP